MVDIRRDVGWDSHLRPIAMKPIVNSTAFCTMSVAYAMSTTSVRLRIRPSVCLSVTLVNCDHIAKDAAKFWIPHEHTITQFSDTNSGWPAKLPPPSGPHLQFTVQVGLLFHILHKLRSCQPYQATWALSIPWCYPLTTASCLSRHQSQ